MKGNHNVINKVETPQESGDINHNTTGQSGSQFYRLAFWCSLGSAGLGFISILGWLLKLSLLIRFQGDFIPIAPSTAMGFLLLGLVNMLYLRSGFRHWIFPGFAAGVWVLSGWIFLQFFSIIPGDIEVLFIQANEKLGNVPIGRMSPLTAVGFLFSSIAAYLLWSDKVSKSIHFLAAVFADMVFLIGSLVVLGYVYGTPLLYGGSVIPVALPTGIAFVMLGTALIATAGPEGFPLRYFTGSSVRARLMRTFIPVIVLVILFIRAANIFLIQILPLNPVLITSANAIAIAFLAGILIARLSDTIAKRIHQAEEQRRSVSTELERSEERFRMLVESALTGVYLIQDNVFQYVNPALARIFDYSQEEITGKLGPEDLTAPQDKSLVHNNIDKRIQGGLKDIRYSFKGLRKDGELIDVEVHGARVEYQGQPAVVGTLVDRTQQIRDAEQLRLQGTALETAANAIVITDRNGIIQWVNPAFTELTGYPFDDVVGKNPRILNSGQHDTTYFKEMWDTILAGKVWRGETINCHADGHLYTEEQTITPVRDKAGEITHFIGIKLDISTRKQLENSLRNAETRYRSIFEHSVVGMYQTSLEGGFIMANPTLARILGYSSPKELIDSYSDLNQQFYVEVERRQEFIETIKSKGQIANFESQVYRKDGESVWISENARGLYDQDGSLTGFEGTTIDITQRRKAEDEQARLTAIIESTPDFVATATPDGRVLYYNRAARELLGLKYDEEIKQIKIQDTHPEWAWKIIRDEAIPTTLESGVWRGETALLDKKSKEIPISQVALAHKTDKDEVQYLSTIARDISKRKQAETQVQEALEMAQQSDRVKTLFMSNMSHEIRTPLNSLLGFMDVIEHSVGDKLSDEEKSLFKIMHQSGERITKTIHSILDISQFEAETFHPEKTDVDLKSVIDSCLETLKPFSEIKGLTLEFDCATESYQVKADHYCVQQALINLIDNAIKYTETGGVSVSMKQNAGVLQLEIRDTGIGMSREYLQRIYEPFRQASEGYNKRFQGIGLGLALTKRYLDANEIGLEVESREGEGSRFILTFPEVRT